MLFFLFGYFIPLKLYNSARKAGIKIGITDILKMRLRKVPPAVVLKPLIEAKKEGLSIEHEKLQAHYLAGGDVERVIDALLFAKQKRVDFKFERAAAMDLGDYDLREEINKKT